MSTSPISGSSPSPSPPPSADTLSSDFVNTAQTQYSDGVDTLMQILLTGWAEGLQETKKMTDIENAKDASNVASAYPMLMQPQPILLNETQTSVAEKTSRAEGQGITGVSTDIPVRGASAEYAFLMAHALGAMTPGHTMGTHTLASWLDLNTEKAVSLLSFLAASESSKNAADDEIQDDGASAALARFSKTQADSVLKLASEWRESIQKLGEELDKLDEKKVIRAMNEYVNEGKKDPNLLDALHVQTFVAVTQLALLVGAGPSPIQTRPDNLVSQVSIVEASAMNPTMGQVDTTAAVAMIAALMAQVTQAQVVLLQIAEKPVIDSKKVSEAFALENARKIIGLLDNPATTTFLKNLVVNMIGKENVERNVALVKLNMMLTALWVLGRAETNGVNFVEILMMVRQFLKEPDKKLPFEKSDIRYTLLAKIKAQIDTFSAEFGAAELEDGLMRMMHYMDGAGKDASTSDIRDPKKMYAGFLSTPPPVDASHA